MKLMTRSPRRTIMAAAIASAAVLLPAVALASSAGSSSATAGSATASSAATTTGTHALATPRCARSSLTAWLGVPGGATAGSTYYQLEISNVSGHACTLYGFPGVSALGRNGRQLGSTAARNHAYTELTVTLQPYQTTHAVLQITDVGNFSRAACRPATADALRVYAPGDFASIKFPFSFRACARKGPVYLHVSTTISGTGIPGYTG
ncbi:MAG TPA: DUF4232 domain-containing protein [Streptosporangiaceae bacterium]|nr:DUF4232 domain-containing protein [Streptosporangiaceae bacterium]